MPNLRKESSQKVGKPVKPKKPLPTKQEPAKIPVPCAVLTEEKVRGIVREEIREERGITERTKKLSPTKRELRSVTLHLVEILSPYPDKIRKDILANVDIIIRILPEHDNNHGDMPQDT